MTSVQNVQVLLRKRKMFLIFPLLVLPFLILGFWAVGGGGSSKDKEQIKLSGLNPDLPDAHLKDEKTMDKLSFYERAQNDSAKLAEQIRADPYFSGKEKEDLFQLKEDEGIPVVPISRNENRSSYKGLNMTPYNRKINPEDELVQKLSFLQKEIGKPSPIKEKQAIQVREGERTEQFSSEVDRLESMMQFLGNEKRDDPEMKQLENTLEKILDVQHPERIKEKLKVKEQEHTIFPVQLEGYQDNISLLNADDTSKRKEAEENYFWGLEGEKKNMQKENAIEAVVHDAQTVSHGGVVKLRLLQDVHIDGQRIAKDGFVFGTASLEGERLQIEINSIKNNHSLFPVKMKVYDLDGLPGISVPGALTSDVAKESADNSLQLMQLSSLDPSLKTQATAAGISSVKNLLSKKTKQVKAFVKAGYKVLIKDNQ